MKVASKILYIKQIILFCLIFISSPVLSQNGKENCSNIINDSSIYEESLIGEFFIPTSLYKGPNFYNPDWRYGTIVLESGKQVYNKYINYHLLTGQLIWIRNLDYKQITIEKATAKEFIISPNDTIKKILFRKIKFQPWYKIEPIKEYLQVLSQGHINLYAFRKASINKNSFEVIPVTEYYVQINNGELSLLRRGRWSLYAAVGEDEMMKKIMKKIVRGNHLRVRKEVNLIKAINLFNQEIKKVKN